MKKAIIVGNKFLSGDVHIDGAKNSILALIPACLLINGKITLQNACNINDVKCYLKIFDDLKIKYQFHDNELIIYSKKIKSTKIHNNLIEKFRASYYLMGSLIGRYKKISINLPGGCNIGARPIDFHLEAFEKLGCKYNIKDKYINVKSKRLLGNIIEFKKKSVGATINTILASVYAKGMTIIKNASLEPEVDDLITFLNELGFHIFRISDCIGIKGVRKVIKNDLIYKVMPDRIETLSYMILGLCIGDLKIKNIDFNSIENVYNYFKNLGCNINFENSVLYVKKSNIDSLYYETKEHPGLPTDISQIVGVYMSLCKNGGVIKETIFENRFDSFFELNKMKAKNDVKGNCVEIKGIPYFEAALVKAKDLRGCAALVFAGLCARGVTEVENIEFMERGYADFVQKITKIGGNIIIKDMNK